MKDVASIAAQLLTREERLAIPYLDASNLKHPGEEELHEEVEVYEWERPISFDDYMLPPFPTEIFPGFLRKQVEGIAETTQTPKDLAAMAAFSVLSITAAKKFEVGITGSWTEPINTYMLTLMGPANRKSAVFNLMTEPILNFEKEERERLKVEIKQRKSEIKVLEKRREHLINANAKKPDSKYIDEIKKITAELETLPEIHPPVFIIDDVTPESLQQALQENAEKVGVLSAEGGIFEIIQGRYSKELNMDIFLKGHSGDYSRTDRKHGAPIILEKPALTIGIFAQPDVLQDLPKAFSGRGLMARFLYSVPKDFKGYRKIRPKDLPFDTREEYSECIKKLLKIETEEPQVLTLTEEADYYFQYLQQDVERRLRNDGDLSELEGWGGKLVGQLARIAGLLHISEYIVNSANIPPKIEKETILSILRLKEYFINHAMAAFGCMGTNEDLENLKYLLAIIERKAKEKYSKNSADEPVLTYREVQQWTKKRFKKSIYLQAALKELEEFGHINEMKDGRRILYQINPFLYKEPWESSTISHNKAESPEPQEGKVGKHKISTGPNSPDRSSFDRDGGATEANGGEWEIRGKHSKTHIPKHPQQLGELGEQFKNNKGDSSADGSELI